MLFSYFILLKRNSIILNNKGYAFPFTFVVIIILFILLAAVQTLTLSNYKNAAYWSNRIKAFYLAESGINEALYQLMENNLLPDDEIRTNDPEVVTGRGTYSWWWEGNKIYSEGRYLNARKTISIEISGGTIFPQAVVDLSVEQEEELGYYYNYRCIPGGIQMPEIPAGEAKEVDSDQDLTPGEHKFTDFILGNNESITIFGPASIYVTGNFTLDQNSQLNMNGDVTFYIWGELRFNENSTINITGGTSKWYVDGDVHFDNGGVLNPDQEAASMLVFVTESSSDTDHNVYIENNSTVIAGIYNPTGGVYIRKNSETTGSVIGGIVGKQENNPDKKNMGTVIYDDSLEDIFGFNSDQWEVVKGSWEES